MGHDAQTTRENQCNDGNVGTVPQELTILKLVILAKSFGFAFSLHLPNVEQLGRRLQLGLVKVLLNELVVGRLFVYQVELSV